MRYGLGSLIVCLFLKFGVVKRQIFDKLVPKSDKCLFMGYPKEIKGYYFYNSSENKVFVARMLYFYKESTYPKELIRVKFTLMKFEHHKEALNRLWKLNRFHKMLLNLHK